MQKIFLCPLRQNKSVQYWKKRNINIFKGLRIHILSYKYIQRNQNSYTIELKIRRNSDTRLKNAPCWYIIILHAYLPSWVLPRSRLQGFVVPTCAHDHSVSCHWSTWSNTCWNGELGKSIIYYHGEPSGHPSGVMMRWPHSATVFTLQLRPPCSGKEHDLYWRWGRWPLQLLLSRNACLEYQVSRTSAVAQARSLKCPVQGRWPPTLTSL